MRMRQATVSIISLSFQNICENSNLNMYQENKNNLYYQRLIFSNNLTLIFFLNKILSLNIINKKNLKKILPYNKLV